jgi:hypothetical protein
MSYARRKSLPCKSGLTAVQASTVLRAAASLRNQLLLVPERKFNFNFNSRFNFDPCPFFTFTFFLPFPLSLFKLGATLYVQVLKPLKQSRRRHCSSECLQSIFQHGHFCFVPDTGRYIVPLLKDNRIAIAVLN